MAVPQFVEMLDPEGQRLQVAVEQGPVPVPRDLHPGVEVVLAEEIAGVMNADIARIGRERIEDELNHLLLGLAGTQRLEVVPAAASNTGVSRLHTRGIAAELGARAV